LGVSVPLVAFTSVSALLLLGGGEGLDVFFCWLVV